MIMEIQARHLRPGDIICDDDKKTWTVLSTRKGTVSDDVMIITWLCSETLELVVNVSTWNGNKWDRLT